MGECGIFTLSYHINKRHLEKIVNWVTAHKNKVLRQTSEELADSKK